MKKGLFIFNGKEYIFIQSTKIKTIIKKYTNYLQEKYPRRTKEYIQYILNTELNYHSYYSTLAYDEITHQYKINFQFNSAKGYTEIAPYKLIIL